FTIVVHRIAAVLPVADEETARRIEQPCQPVGVLERGGRLAAADLPRLLTALDDPRRQFAEAPADLLTRALHRQPPLLRHEEVAESAFHLLIVLALQPTHLVEPALPQNGQRQPALHLGRLAHRLGSLLRRESLVNGLPWGGLFVRDDASAMEELESDTRLARQD